MDIVHTDITELVVKVGVEIVKMYRKENNMKKLRSSILRIYAIVEFANKRTEICQVLQIML